MSMEVIVDEGARTKTLCTLRFEFEYGTVSIDAAVQDREPPYGVGVLC